MDTPVVVELNGIQIEIYRHRSMDELVETCKDAQVEEKTAQMERSMKLLVGLGLTRQAEKTKRDIEIEEKTSDIDPALFYRAVSGYERYIWRQFLPTGYSKRLNSWDDSPFSRTFVTMSDRRRHSALEFNADLPSSRPWEEYDFDMIPLECLEEINFAVETRFFRSLEIRTVEPIQLIVWRKLQEDPAVFGHSWDGRCFMITRWGESLMPFEEIREKIEGKIPSWFRRQPMIRKKGARHGTES